MVETGPRRIKPFRWSMARMPDGTSGYVLTAMGPDADPIYAAAGAPGPHASAHVDGGADPIDAALKLSAIPTPLAGKSADMVDGVHLPGTIAEVLSDPDHACLTNVLPDQHHARDHSARHVDGGADEINSPLNLGAIPEHGAAKHTNVTRTLFIPAFGYTTGSLAQMDFHTSHLIPDAAVKQSYFTFMVPSDFVSFTSLKAVWVCAAASGNMKWHLSAEYGAAGENYATHMEGPASGLTATGGAWILNVQLPANALTLANLAKGHYVGIEFERLGTAVDDTLDADVYLLGLLFTYIAEQ